ncbi:MAG: GNAT family N-acetyltransferase [Pseudomonadota bacterium]
MSVTVAEFRREHEEAFRSLHRACLAHYAVPPATPAQEDRILSLLRVERHMACHLAFNGDDPVGFATWGLCFPAGAGISLMMKELFVAERGRRMGVGKALLAALIDRARREGCERFDWATDGTNAAAQAFYASINAPEKSKQNYSLPSQEFGRFLRRLKETTR